MRLPFGRWMPDRPPHDNPGVIDAKNVIHGAGFYRPVPALAAYSDPLPARCRGIIAARRTDGTVFNFVGTANGLFEQTSLGWTDRSKPGGHALAEAERWEFVQWGERILAVGGLQDGSVKANPQAITLGGATFTDLAGNPPQAKHIAVVRSFVMLGDVNDSIDGRRSQRLWWSGIGDETYWTPDIRRQCSFSDLRGSGGDVMRIVGGEIGVVFRRRSIARLLYIGAPGVFQIDDIEDGVGTPAPWSVVKFGRLIYFLADDGFYAFDGAESHRLGEEVVDGWFRDNFNAAYPESVWAAVDPIRRIVIWAFPSPSSVGGVPDRLLFYNPSTKGWSYAEQGAEVLGALYGNLSTSLDSLDAIYPSIDAMGDLSLDDPIFQGGRLQLVAFDSQHRAALLNGPNLEAVIETAEGQLFPPQRSFVQVAAPLIEGTSDTARIEIATRDKVSDPPVYHPAQTIDADGLIYPEVDGRYLRARVRMPAGAIWDKAYGLEITQAIPSGEY